MKWSVAVSVLVLAFLCVSADVFAAAGGWRRSVQDRVYDAETVATMTGTVLKVDEITRAGGRSSGIHVTMQTGEGVVEAHLGPKWYIDNLNLGLKEGDVIEVTGSRLQIDETQVILVRSLKRGEETVVLRDEDGVPNWSGWRRGGRR